MLAAHHRARRAGRRRPIAVPAQCATPRGRNGSDPRCCAAPKSRCSARRRPARSAAARRWRRRVLADAGCREPTGPWSAWRARRGAGISARRRGHGRGDAAAEGGRRGGGGRGGRGGGAGVLRLHREPALATLVASGGDPGRRATALLARIEWPGQARRGRAGRAALGRGAGALRRRPGGLQESLPGVSPAGRPRRRSGVAPAFVGSALALAPAGVPGADPVQRQGGSSRVDAAARAAVLTDEQIAAVLTYVRREWGQAGSPVDAASVKETRTATAGRLKPWTDAELQALIAGK